MTHAHMDSPLGRLTLIARAGHLRGIYLPDQAVDLGRAGALDPADPVLAETARQLGEYFEGRRTSFDLPLDAAGTDFQRSVWSALGQIPYGETRAYSDLARAVGKPKAARAVGAANGKNPLSIVVPCHRVVGRDGRLHGYAGGERAKAWLLRMERGTA